MKKNSFKILILSLLISISVSSFADNDNKDIIKTNWNLGILPTLSYNSDLGLQYGVMSNLYYFGDGKIYPDYYHLIYLEASRYTKGSYLYRLFYDSKYLIKNFRTIFDISYGTDHSLDFYGFNGYQTTYNKSWINPDKDNYKTRVFYKLKRKTLRIKFDLQAESPIKNLNWSLGVNCKRIGISSVDIDKLNKGKKGDKILPDTTTLFDEYVNWGLINEDEKKGGWLNYAKGGLIYDTRNNETNATKGIWTEIIVLQSLNKKNNHTKLGITHRQYFTLLKDKLSFVYRLSYQSMILGKVPFYALPYVHYSYNRAYNNDGLGGAKTIRGVIRNRVVGKSVMFANCELRWKFVKFHLFNQNFYLLVSPFLDAGMVIEDYPIDKSKIPASVNQSNYFSGNNETPHISYGVGLHIAMNENFVVCVDYGIPHKKEDGTKGLYINMNYLF